MRRNAFPFAVIFSLLLAPSGAAVSTRATEATPESGIAWLACATPELPTKECGELAVPLDYDDPAGTTITLVVARVPATDQTERMGSLFLNPGGPGNSGIQTLPMQYTTLPVELQERFDVVGFDARGVGGSAPVKCFASIAEKTAFEWQYLSTWIAPANSADAAAAVAAYEDFARACGELNADILPHLSTANVAQDLDRLREAVGDEQLNYLGTSYGTYLGETYANLFPDRIRAMVIDGVINPPSYTSFDQGDGDISGPETTSFTRILSAEASIVALDEFMAQCAAAGVDHCAFAAASAAETRAKFDALMTRLRAEPMIVSGPAGTLTVTYSLVVFTVFSVLYATPEFPILAQALHELDEGNAAGFLTTIGLLGGPLPTDYLNSKEALWAINCVDTDNPSDPAAYGALAQSVEEQNPYFGSLWALYSLPCAFWPAQDEDRYQGPWDAQTSATILLISRVFDPATPHGGAIQAAEELGNAQLLTIDGWGHGYYSSGQSTCANEAMVAYFIDGQLPAEGTVCQEDTLPFSE